MYSLFAYQLKHPWGNEADISICVLNMLGLEQLDLLGHRVVQRRIERLQHPIRITKLCC